MKGRSGREGVVHDVNVYAAAVVSVRYDDDQMSVLPVMFHDLTNLSRPS